jgi:hypothetical protein
MSARTIRYEFFDSIGHERQIENVRAMYACTPTPEVSLQCGKRSSWAMCGRLRVGKENLHVAGLGRCSHVFGL